ncbi:tyrosine-type recombinase/integrase [Pseudonocardia acidicola]|uniref:Site-specific integrase n=1 Tax=Pseudonocardia acidicola TaxID=2724939 RepID=A0ABX1SH08_9PSEU|nr:site-specific integrase [Pseudonocardia acidicola]NMI00851.1 site-specific integrase [Pseudonocardia acidicola]
MGFIDKTPEGRYRAYFRDPAGRQRSKTFRLKKDAASFLAEVETAKSRGAYVAPNAGRMLFGEHAQQWMATWNTEATTAARDLSVMRTHVLPQWSAVQLGKIDHLGLQAWATELGKQRSRATVVEALRLTSAVLRSAVRNRLIPFNPAEDVRVPRTRRRDTDERVISRADLRGRLLPAVPERYRGIVATAAGAGLRWGEAAGLRVDALDLDAARLHVIRTVIEVSGHTSFKPFPKSRAGRRTVPLPAWLVTTIRAHLDRWPTQPSAPIFANEVGGALRRTLFRTRVWRPSLVRAGMLGAVVAVDGGFEAQWSDADGTKHTERLPTETAAVHHVARNQAGGLRFHDLRHSYATWLVDDGVPPNMVQRVMGHERSSTTLDLYTRRTDNSDRILEALDDEDDPDDGRGMHAPT